MATLKYYNGSAWTTVADGTAFKYYNGSNWVNPTKVQYYDGSNWQTVWNKSNAVTLVFQAVDSNSWRQGGWRGSSDLRIGSWDYGDHIGLVSFVTGNNTNSATAADGTSVSADTLANHLAERTVINSCTLTLYRESGAGFNPIGATGNTESLYLGYYDGTIGSGDADDDINTTNMTTIAASDLNALGWNYNESQTLTFAAATAAQLGTKELWMANRTSSFASSPGGGQDTTYSTFNGHSDTNKPTLTIELDYV